MPLGWINRLAITISLPFLLSGADWPQFLGPTRNGISPETGLRDSWPKSGPPLLWEKDVGAGFSGPIVVGERVILCDRQGDDERVVCFDASTGKEQWKFPYPATYRDDFGFDEGPRSTPLAAGGRVFTLGAAGDLHCLDLATGRKIWARQINQDYGVRKGFFGVATSPILEGDHLILNVGGPEAGIVAFNKDSGQEVWRATKHEAGYASPVAADLDGQRIVAFLTREGIVLLDPKTGKVRYTKHWRARGNASVNAATPVVVGDRIFFSSSYQTGAIVLRVRGDDVTELWHNDESLSSHYNTSVAYRDHLFGIDGRQEEGGRLRCIEFATGKVCWTVERFGCASLLLAGGRLLALTERGELVLLDATPEAFRERARARILTNGDCRAAPALSGGRLYARDPKKLGCWDLRK